MSAVACIASHSALDVFDGAKDEGLKTIAICRRGREKIYSAARETVDDLLILNSYKDLTREDVQRRLNDEQALIVPNRSMAVYVGYDDIEERLSVPVFGNKRMLRWEERVGEKNYYELLSRAGIPHPRRLSVEEVDGPVIVKLQEAKRPQERAFIVASSREELERKAEEMRRLGLIAEGAIEGAVIEELVLGAHFNINYFQSRVRGRLELISVDRRIQSDLDGILRIPARDQLGISKLARMIEVGHMPATLRESLLNEAYEIGERFVNEAARLEPPGIIGPFTLQAIVTPDLRLVVYDVATRIGGGTNAHMSIGGHYAKLFLRRAVSMGRRVCMEINEARELGMLNLITS